MEYEKNLKKVGLYIRKMPSLPTSVAKVLELANDPNVSPADLNQVISLDPVLMGKVMKLINSAYYGLHQRITSLVRAIIMLGVNTVKNLALSTAILSNLGSDSHFQVINMNGYWRHSLCVGVTAKLIAKQKGVPANQQESFFVAGLLHDIGKIPLNNTLSQEYLEVLALSDRTRKPLYRSEKEIIGFSHADVGNIISKAWKLGDEIHDAIVYHHRCSEYTGPHRIILLSVIVANYFANSYDIGFSGNRYPEAVPQELYNELGISLDWLESVEEQVNQEIDKAKVFLKIAE
ncbi:MAG: HDOD domain-containing protein [Spirochaetaceae bacterium]|nr:HDOD domain-containing protein [Spirochaetaceae bacterium]MCF7948587.1 HDOD domain-containing protein [Spirochaetia bacterium]MCF7951965.1 HDOD domain-containing protein [Spirochaetaceae bacterium]